MKSWNSRKLFVVLLNIIVVGFLEWKGDVTLYTCIALTGPTMIYLGGQSIIDAVEKFAEAKFAK